MITTIKSLEAQKMYDKEKKEVKEQTTKDSYGKGSYSTISEMEKTCGGKANYSESGLRKQED